MATIKKYNGSTWENAVVRKYGTASEIIVPPTTIYADGTAISTYTIKGNTTQSGTPTPSNPVAVVGVGELTDNLFNVNDSSSMSTAGCTATVSNNTLSQVNTGAYSRTVWEFNNIVPDDKYTVTLSYNNPNNCSVQIRVMDSDNSTLIAATAATTNTSGTLTLTFTARNTTQYIRIYSNTLNAANNETVTFTQIMIVEGETAPTSYIPWGYKIPILINQQTIDIYIGDLPLLKSLDGTAVDEISNGTLTRRVAADGSVLPTPITTQITMPSIPTTDGANSITVDTTVQPSEFTATWTGWHDNSVKEYDGSQWQ